jgi:hypothetical protein
MRMNKKRWNWVVDGLLVAGFLLTFLINLTGLSLHQWLGVWLVALAAYHLLRHWGWCKAVTERLFKQASWKSRYCWFIDASLLLGFSVILVTGLAISTWLQTFSIDYDRWRDLHLISSYLTLAFIIVKLAMKMGLRQRRIGHLSQKLIGMLAGAFPPAPQVQTTPVSKLQPERSGISRRQLISLIGTTGIAALLTINHLRIETVSAAAASLSERQLTTAAPSQPQSWTVSTATKGTSAAPLVKAAATVRLAQVSPAEPIVLAAAYTPANAAGTVQCRKQLQCVYPGRCRRYVDGNRNGICDLGERL